MIGFETIRERLIGYLRESIQNGAATERALALRAGISQPHLHNMLKGVRSLNPGMADQLMVKLGLSVLDLVESDELRRVLYCRARDGEPAVEVPVLRDRLGPGLRWPDRSSPFELVRVPVRVTAHVPHPLVVRLADDPAMAPYLRPGELILLDDSTEGLATRDPDALFAVEHEGATLIRWLRRGRDCLYLVTLAFRDQPRDWKRVTNAAVRARAIPLRSTQKPEFVYDPLLPRDIPRGPARLFCAS